MHRSRLSSAPRGALLKMLLGASGAHSAGINNLPRVPVIGPPRPLTISVQPDTKDPLLKANTAAANKAPKNTLEADENPTCFENLTWEDAATKAKNGKKSTTRENLSTQCLPRTAKNTAHHVREKCFWSGISYGSLGGFYWDELGGSEEGFFE